MEWIKYALVICWIVFIGVLISGRDVGAWGVETDWYGSYAPQADAFRENGIIPIDDFRGPLYQVTLGTVSLVTEDTWEAGQLINLVCSVLCVVLFFGICAALGFSSLQSTIAALALMLTPVFVRASVECGTDIFFLGISLAAVWAIIKERDILAGVLIGLAILTRANGFALVIPALLMNRYRWSPIVLSFFLAWGCYTQYAVGSFFHNMNYLNTAALTVPTGWLEELWYGGGPRLNSWFDLASIDTFVAVWNNAQSVVAGIFTKLWFFPASFLAIVGLSKIKSNVPIALFVGCVPLLFLIAFDTRYALTIAPLFALGIGGLCEKQYMRLS